jgi:hypothetical protein
MPFELFLACLRIYEAYAFNLNSNYDYRNMYYEGALYICIHLSLLNNPTFPINVIILFFIALVNVVASQIGYH